MGRASRRRFLAVVTLGVVLGVLCRLNQHGEKAIRQALHRHNPIRPNGDTAADRLKARRRGRSDPKHPGADMPGWGDAGLGDPNVAVDESPPTLTAPNKAFVAHRPRPARMAAPVDDGGDSIMGVTVVELRLKDDRDRVSGRIRIRLTPALSGPRSAAYLQTLATVEGGLNRDHNIFRNEPSLLLQGRLCVC